MMPDMSHEEQPKAAASSPDPRWWLLPALAGILAIYVLWMGETIAWNDQRGHHWYFLAPWWTSTSLKFLALSAGLAAVFHFGGARGRRGLPVALAAVLLGGQIWCARAAWNIVGGATPYGIDHPSFLLRLKEFGDVFPGALGGYLPWWNGGIEHFIGVTSGAHGFGLLILPLLKIWPPHAFYGAALVFWFVFGFPWLGAAAVHAAGVSRAGALCAGILVCGASREVFMWAWHFGTVGAMTSAMLALPVAALGYRLAVLRRGSWGTALALGLAAWLMCLWTPGVFIAAGLGLGWLWNFRAWTWRSNRWLFAAGALALALLAPWFWTTWFPCGYVVDYVGAGGARPAWTALAANGTVRLLKALQEWHPALLFLGLLGVALAGPRELRRWTLPVLLLLGAITGWSREFKPQSQMERMATAMALVAALPAAAACGRLFAGAAAGRGGWRAAGWALAQGVVLATLLFGVGRAHAYYANRDRTGIKMRTLSAELRDWVRWIRAEVPAEGRLAFVGSASHFYGGGNVAYLPVLADREMMADDYYGTPPGAIEYNYPPAAYREDVDRWLFFSRAYGITHWVGYRPAALAFFAAHPEQFEQVAALPMSGSQLAVFRVKAAAPPTRFLEGAGRVDARENRLEVWPADPRAERVVIRYNWREGLHCRTPGASIEPFAVDEHLRFIAVHPGGNACVAIGYRPHWAPLAPNFDGFFHH